jgi:pyridoxal phosphate enzyme (YggS family)
MPPDAGSIPAASTSPIRIFPGPALSILRQNVEVVRARIAEAALRSGRKPDSVRIVAAAKGMDAERVEEAIACGISIIGENRVQEAGVKKSRVSLPADWHMIGHLQTNKVKRALEIFSTIQSVDSARLAEELEKRAESSGKKVDVLIEVNTSGESSKYGVEPPGLLELVASLKTMSCLNVNGLMTIGVFSEEPEDVRPCFRLLRELRDRCLDEFGGLPEMGILSMGMSGDFETAIEEGSTMVRVGTAIFGARRYQV